MHRWKSNQYSVRKGVDKSNFVIEKFGNIAGDGCSLHGVEEVEEECVVF